MSRTAFVGITQAYLAIALGAGVGFALAAGAHTLVAHLEQSTAQQCATQDWPASKHAAMTAWCRDFELTRQQFGRY